MNAWHFGNSVELLNSGAKQKRRRPTLSPSACIPCSVRETAGNTRKSAGNSAARRMKVADKSAGNAQYFVNRMKILMIFMRKISRKYSMAPETKIEQSIMCIHHHTKQINM